MHSSMRFFSARNAAGVACAMTLGIVSPTIGQDASGFFTNPDTGIVYRKVARTIDRPVVETKMQTQESTVYRPEVVVTNRPETRTVYTPVVTYSWEPRMTNAWNPFSKPTVVYEHKPRTHWEARTETVQRPESVTNWIAETRKVDVPQQIVRIQREEKIDYEPIGRSGSTGAAPPNSASNAEIAARLRPLDPGTKIEPLYAAPAVSSSYAATSMRNDYRNGMRANDLTRQAQPAYSMPLPPGNLGIGVAGNPMPSAWR